MDTVKKDLIIDVDGVRMDRIMRAERLEQSISKNVYHLFGRSTLDNYFKSIALTNTAYTISAWETASGIDVDANFTDTDSYYWRIPAVIQGSKVIKTGLWYTILTDAGLYFALPARRTGAIQLTNYKVVTDNSREAYFDSVDYDGETGANFTIALDTLNSFSIPDTIDSTQKGRVLNKYLSQNRVIKVQSGKQNIQPCDYFVYKNEVMVILSKKEIRNGYYEYVGVKEVTTSWTFGAADVTPLIPFYASAGYAFQQIPVKVGAEQTFVNAPSLTSNTSYTINLECTDKGTGNTDNKRRMYVLQIDATGGSAGGSRIIVTIVEGGTVSTTPQILDMTTLEHGIRVLEKEHGKYTIGAYVTYPGAGPSSLVVKGYEIEYPNPLYTEF